MDLGWEACGQGVGVSDKEVRRARQPRQVLSHALDGRRRRERDRDRKQRGSGPGRALLSGTWSCGRRWRGLSPGRRPTRPVPSWGVAA